MEVAGLALGAVGIAGVLGAFKDTIDLLHMFYEARSSDRDFDILAIKFDIEKVLLCQWADRVKLLQSDRDERLDDAEVQKMVSQILKCISTLLEDTNRLKSEYGLEQQSTTHHSHNNRVLPSCIVSRAQVKTFTERFEALSFSSSRPKFGGSIRRKGRWVIQDKAKFETLIAQLNYFRASLNDLIPNTNDPRTDAHSQTPVDLKGIDELHTLKLVNEASVGLSRPILKASQNAIDRICQKRLLDKLWFKGINDRENSISEAHVETFGWVLKSPAPDEELAYPNFASWLSSGSGLYWFSGKAGSGKSTLMKFVASHSKTRDLLSSWAGGPRNRIYLCTFFLTALGSTRQKSLRGLMRSLLYQILSYRPSLIQETCPAKWKEVYETGEIQHRLDTTELKTALTLALDRISALGLKFCFFIDGLDEFDGDCRDVISLVHSLCSQGSSKCVVSSRPIPLCVDAFENSPRLRLQDLTRKDIEKYVLDTVGQHQYMKRILAQNPTEGGLIIQDIIDKASGVFLWVVLACKSLLDGFVSYDRLSELRRRVDELPEEMEDLFRQMLNRVQTRYGDQAARFLRICFAYYQSQSLPFCLENPLDATSFGLLDDDYDRGCIKLRCLSLSETCDLERDLEGRLRSRCGGLLEIRPHPVESLYDDSYHFAEVVFMHRTVFEFLSDSHVWELDCLRCLSDDFSEEAALSALNLHMAMQYDSENSRDQVGEQWAMPFVEEGLLWAQRADRRPNCLLGAIFDRIEPLLDFLERLFMTSKAPFYNRYLQQANTNHPCEQGGYCGGLVIATELFAVNYVQRHPLLQAVATDQSRSFQGTSLLSHAISSPILNLLGIDIQDDVERCLFFLPLCKVLLSAGSDPNEKPALRPKNNISPWETWLKRLDLPSLSTSDLLNALDIVSVFLEYGADPRPSTLDLLSCTDRIQEEHLDTRVQAKAQHVKAQMQNLLSIEGDLETPTSGDSGRRGRVSPAVDAAQGATRGNSKNEDQLQDVNSGDPAHEIQEIQEPVHNQTVHSKMMYSSGLKLDESPRSKRRLSAADEEPRRIKQRI